MGIGSFGFSEMLVIFVIVLVFFGPRRLPEIARSLGHAMREFRRSLNQIQRELEEADPRTAFPDGRSAPFRGSSPQTITAEPGAPPADDGTPDRIPTFASGDRETEPTDAFAGSDPESTPPKATGSESD